MNDISIRRAGVSDIPQIVKLLHQVHQVHADIRPDLFLPGKRKYTDDELRQILANDQTPVFGAYNADNVLVGYAFCIFKETKAPSMPHYLTLYIDDLCVDAQVRGRQIGLALYDFVVDFAKRSGCHNLTLNVWQGNDSAMHFYKEKCALQTQKITMEKILD